MSNVAGPVGMAALGEGDRFMLEIAPVGENVRTARLFGASIARHFECDEEQVEDLKLALSEAVNRAFRSSTNGSAAVPVSVSAVKVSGGLKFSVAGPPGGDPADSVNEAEWAPTEEELILAFFPEASFDAVAGTAEFTLSLPQAP